MKFSPNYVLYYPTIEFSDYEWLWTASLVWDKIYRIVPESYELNDCENVQRLSEDGEIGEMINPSKYVEDASKEFLSKIKTSEWDAITLDDQQLDQEYIFLHKEKVDVMLKSILLEKYKDDYDWIKIPRSLAACYMTYLARRIADNNNLSLISDSISAYTASTYFQYDGKIEVVPFEDKYQLSAIVLQDYIPENILDVTPQKILEFRRKYKDERQNFVAAMKIAAEKISECDDPKIVEDLIKDLKKDIEKAIEDYKKSMSLFNVKSWSGMKVLSFPIATSLFEKLNTLDPNLASYLTPIGLGLGLYFGIRERNQKVKKLSKESDFSYLSHLKKDLPDIRIFGTSFYREMDDFIND